MSLFSPPCYLPNLFCVIFLSSFFSLLLYFPSFCSQPSTLASLFALLHSFHSLSLSLSHFPLSLSFFSLPLYTRLCILVSHTIRNGSPRQLTNSCLLLLCPLLFITSTITSSSCRFFSTRANSCSKKILSMTLICPVDSTILFFRRDLVVVMILEYTRENRIHLLTIIRLLLSDRFIRSFFKTHKSHVRKIQIERYVALKAIKLKAQSLWFVKNKTNHKIPSL